MPLDRPSEVSQAQPSTAMRSAQAAERAELLADFVEGLLQGENAETAAELDQATGNALIQVRLGIASSLFTALRYRHADSAEHSLRVTVACSSWATHRGMAPQQRDELELAALLHDVGKISVPDSILLKPSPLTQDELAIMERHRLQGIEVLRTSCTNAEVLTIIRQASLWYDLRNASGEVSPADVSIGARMLAIADAFDAMTHDQFYRLAVSRERAIAELYRGAGTQFDPALVKEFAALIETDPTETLSATARRWLQDLDPRKLNANWRLAERRSAGRSSSKAELFYRRCVEHMQEAAIFIDDAGRIFKWNNATERLTGLSATAVMQHTWEPNLLDLRDSDGCQLSLEECHVQRAIESGDFSFEQWTIRGRAGRQIRVNAQIMPVVGSDGAIHGACILLRDVSSEISLAARCQNLHEIATKDRMTGTANRAEFDRVHQLFVKVHEERNLPCSLIITDIDFFKQVNDTYGHPAGDEAIKGFARVLKRHAQPGDMVARYGGEEFVMLLADCNNACAADRAEQLRREFSELVLPEIGNNSCTASFGVTEIQSGDTTETMLNRADRALLLAKQRGRNQVVQLGTGYECKTDEEENTTTDSPAIVEQVLYSCMPQPITLEKIRGFASDHRAEYEELSNQRVRIRVGNALFGFLRRGSDRRLGLQVDVEISDTAGRYTCLHVQIRPCNQRDRRHASIRNNARRLLHSFRAYIVATTEPPPGLTPPADDDRNR